MIVKVKVPDRESIMFFKERWNPPTPFVGEYELPYTSDRNRLLTVDSRMVSHIIKSIDWKSFDPHTKSILIDVDFTGPLGSLATSDWLKQDIRFAPRTIMVGKKRRIITWDLVHRPMDIGKPTPVIPKSQEEQDREGKFNETVEKMQKEMIDSDEGSVE